MVLPASTLQKEQKHFQQSNARKHDHHHSDGDEEVNNERLNVLHVIDNVADQARNHRCEKKRERRGGVSDHIATFISLHIGSA